MLLSRQFTNYKVSKGTKQHLMFSSHRSMRTNKKRLLFATVDDAVESYIPCSGEDIWDKSNINATKNNRKTNIIDNMIF